MIEAYYGYNAPFSTSQSKALQRQVNERIIKNDLLQLLLTSPGDRMMRPEFGVGLRRFVFELQTNSGLSTLKERIADQVKMFESRVTLSDILFDKQENVLNIKLLGSINLDRFASAQDISKSDLLVELNIPTGGH